MPATAASARAAPRAERCWELVARVRGPGSRDRSASDAFERILAALRARS